jgi:hypothetical protein
LLVLVLLVAVSASAQTTALTGVVSDPSGSVIAGATLEIEGATGVKRSTTTTTAGTYNFAQLPPGSYKLTVKTQGFTTKVFNDVQLLVNQPATLNVTLEVGAVTETVSVEASATQVNTVDASLGNAFGSKPILQLPFEARNVVGLLTLQPGVSFTGDAASYRSGNVNGGKNDQANVTLDGVDVNNQQSRDAFTSVLRVTLDSVQEFRVTTTNGGAELGRTSGAQVALITRSGSNELHGALYHFLRNRATNANEFFNNLSGLKVPKLNRNIYGGRIGGAIIKNRLFYFANYEGRQDRSEASVLRLVPSQNMRNGTLSYLTTAGQIVTLTGADLARRIDPLGIGPNAESMRVLKLYPLPNDFTQGDGINIAGFRFNAPIRLRQNTYIAKFDWNVDQASKHVAFLRGNLQNDNSTAAPQFPGQAPNDVQLDNSKGLAAGLTSTFRANLVNSFRYGFTRQGVEFTGISRVTQVAFRGLSDPFGLNRSFTRLTPVNNWTDDVTWTKGKHTVQGGVNIRMIRNRRINYGTSFSTASTNASWLTGSGAPLNSPLTDMRSTFRVAWRDAAMAVMGLVSQGNAQYNYLLDGSVQPQGAPVLRQFNAEEYEMYIQDSWRIRRNLTITAGVRWSLMPPIYEANGYQTSSIQPLSDWYNDRLAFANAGLPQSRVRPVEYVLANQGGRDLYPFHKKNLAPRFAIAWSPEGDGEFARKFFGAPGRTVIRAGWGMFYDLFGSGLITSQDASALGLSTNIANPAGVLNLTTVPRLTNLNTIPPSLLIPAPRGGFPQRQPDVFQITNGLDDRLKPPFTMNMNFSWAREFDNGIFIQASYVGRLSRRSLVSEDIAQPTNLIDPASGIDYFTAAKFLAQLANANTPVANVPRNAFWENIFPGLARPGRTATQAAYEVYQFYAPDYTSALYDLDVFCDPGCSRFGRYALYNAQYSYLRALRSIGFGSYHAGQLTVRKRWRNGDQVDFNYTLGKSIDYASRPEAQGASANGVIINTWSRRQFRAVSDYDTRHIYNANGVYNLPFGKGRKFGSGVGRIGEALIGGWQLSGLWRQTSGLPTSVGNGRFWPTNWNITGYATQVAPVQVGTTKNAPRPTAAGTSGPNLFPDPAAAIRAFDYTLPGETGGRNTLRGDGGFNIDTGLAKSFRLWKEGSTLQFRWEVFNVTNSVRFDPFQISLDLGNIGTFGKYTGTFGTARVMQFGARIDF